MKLIFPTLLIIASVFNSYSQLNKADGPYLFYNTNKANPNNKVTIRAISDSKVRIDSFSKLDVLYVSEHQFKLSLRTKLKNEPCLWKQPDKMFVLSDIEGEFPAFRSLLLAGGVIDSNYEWTFGKGHLVIAGDLFDRGKEVAAELWLLYKLEDEARAKGGYVHTILGNHDIMNLSGDTRYVDSAYFRNAKSMGVDYMDLYARNTELGRWLRTKNVIERIGDRIYTHGGMSPDVLQLHLTIRDLDDSCRPYYDVPLEQSGNLSPVAQLLFGENALFWYRGYFMQPFITEDQLSETLRFYNCKQIVVGHTILDSNIGLYYSGKVIGLDVNEHEGFHQALVYSDGKWFKMDDKGTQSLLTETVMGQMR